MSPDEVFVLYKNKQIQFQGEDAPAKALYLRDNQLDMYEKIFAGFAEIEYRVDETNGSSFRPPQFFASIQGECKRLMGAYPPELMPGTNVVRWHFPLLTRQDVRRFLGLIGMHDSRAEAEMLSLLVSAGPLAEADLSMNILGSVTSDGGRIASYMATYLGAKANWLARNNGLYDSYNVKSQVEEMLADTQSKLAKTQEDATTVAAAVTVWRTEATKLGTLLEQRAEEVSALSQAVATNQDTVEERVAAMQDAIEAKIELGASYQSWKSRSEEASKALRWAATLLVVAFILPIVVAGVWGPSFLEFVNKVNLLGIFSSASGFQIFLSRLLLITVPVFVYLLLLRVVIRYFTLALATRDDVRLRQTMLDTYLILGDKGRVTASDMPVLLTAMFRQGPATGSDSNDTNEITTLLSTILKR